MKLHLSRLITMAIMLGVSGVLVSAMSVRDSAALSFRAQVPFDFQIGEDKFPAGEYQFKQLEQYVLAVEGIGTETDGYALGGNSVGIEDFDGHRLTFHSYGKKNFLRAVSSSASTFELGISEAESKIRKAGKVTLTKRIVNF